MPQEWASGAHTTEEACMQTKKVDTPQCWRAHEPQLRTRLDRNKYFLKENIPSMGNNV